MGGFPITRYGIYRNGVGWIFDVPLFTCYIALCSAIFGKVKNREHDYIYIYRPPAHLAAVHLGGLPNKPSNINDLAQPYPL